MSTNPLYDLIRKNADPNKPYLHIVGFKFPEHVSAAEQDALMRQCAELHDACGGIAAGIRSLITRQNVDPRKGYTWVGIGVYDNPEAFINFHAHPAHSAFSSAIAKVADVWVVLDVSMDFVIT